MQNTSDNEFDAFFRDKLGAFEAQPSDSVWDRIGGELDKSTKRRSAFPTWWAAASVVCLLTCGYWLSRPGEKIRLKGEPAKQLASASSVKPTPLISKVPVSIASPRDGQETIKSEAQLHKSASNVKKTFEGNDERFADVTEAANREDQKPLMSEKTVAIASPPVEEKLMMPTPPPVVLASNNIDTEVHGERVEQEEKQRNGIKSVGDLVNFVVAKVDKRKDKIIEFAEDDEGSVISGINLGLLRIRTKGEKRN